MGRTIDSRFSRRPGLLILALLALWVQVLVPAGFMVSANAATPGLVICTGHGALDLSDQSHSGKAPASKAQAACVFAGHGLANTATPPIRLATPAYAFTAPTAIEAAQASPGQGLAAPPPPARGPPLV